MLYLEKALWLGCRDVGLYKNQSPAQLSKHYKNILYSSELIHLLTSCWQLFFSKACQKAPNFISVKKGFYHGSEGY